MTESALDKARREVERFLQVLIHDVHNRVPYAFRLVDARNAIARLEAAAREDARAKTGLNELRFHPDCQSPFKSPETPEEHDMVRRYRENY